MSRLLFCDVATHDSLSVTVSSNILFISRNLVNAIDLIVHFGRVLVDHSDHSHLISKS
jgi:hypothetical protein